MPLPLTRTWQFRFDTKLDRATPEEEEQVIRHAMTQGIKSQKSVYPVNFWAWSTETKTESGKPHVHIVAEFKEPHDKNITAGIRDRIAASLGISKGNNAEYGSGMWKPKHGTLEYFLGYISKERLATCYGDSTLFEFKGSENAYKFYKKMKDHELKSDVYKIKNKELIDQVLTNIKNNPDYKGGKNISFYNTLIIDEYFAECKRINYKVNNFQTRSDLQKIQIVLSYDNQKIERYLKSKFLDAL